MLIVFQSLSIHDGSTHLFLSTSQIKNEVLPIRTEFRKRLQFALRQYVAAIQPPQSFLQSRESIFPKSWVFLQQGFSASKIPAQWYHTPATGLTLPSAQETWY